MMNSAALVALGTAILFTLTVQCHGPWDSNIKRIVYRYITGIISMIACLFGFAALVMDIVFMLLLLVRGPGVPGFMP
jgi:hypothetical protein